MQFLKQGIISREVNMNKIFVALAFMMLLMISGCAANGGESDNSAIALEAYQTAFAAKNTEQVSLLSCADWEDQALLEMDSFQAVETKLEGLSCTQTSIEDGIASAVCQGKIVTTYGDEQREFDLSTRTFKMVKESGEWLVCGVE